MAQYDSNGDGKLTAADAHWSDLRVWVDANHDGKTDAGELKTLAQLGITALDLHGLAGSTVNNGNLLGLTSSYTTADGASHAMADVWFAKDTAASASAAATAAAPATPALGELLAAPTANLLAGHAADGAVVASTSTSTAPAHAAHTLDGLIDHRLLGADDPQRQQTLL